MRLEEMARLRADARALMAGANCLNDLYVRIFFKDHPGCLEQLLRVYMARPDLKVTGIQVQDPIDLLAHKSVILDVRATDDEDTLYDIEFQLAEAGADFRRLVHYGSSLNVESVGKGGDPRKAPKTVVICLTATDTVGDGEPIHWFERVDVKSCRKDADGECVLTGKWVKGDISYAYVNMAYLRAGTAIGDLNRDLLATDAAQVGNPVLAERAFTLKNMGKGDAEMCSELEEIMKRYKKLAEEEAMQKGMQKGMQQGMQKGMELGEQKGSLERAKAISQALLAKGLLSMAEIAECSGLSIQEVEALKTA